MTASELASRLELGGTPTMRAMTLLESEGFTRPVKRKGWQIAPITKESAKAVFGAYRIVAPGILDLLLQNATEPELDEYVKRTYAWSRGYGEFQADFSVHPISYALKICGNEFVATMAAGVVAHLERMMVFSFRQGSFAEGPAAFARDAVTEAIAVRDKVRAHLALEDLIRHSELEVFKGLSRPLGSRLARIAPAM
ncbi:hypothetical protein Rhow_008547 [Rhodococcus wratislaviensis]|uniref:Transcriptional regulator, GntR family n=1 Tax=Rhodococcus wratislaviensis TaxID=44752 RepID=A0A402CL34_RHOWR|nr:hypothetical protein Rhow_008547 [Rhodococcus wratislaviensis]